VNSSLQPVFKSFYLPRAPRALSLGGHVWIISFFLLLIMANPSTAIKVQQKGKPIIETIVRIFSTWNGRPDPVTYSRAAQYIDYETMAQRALGPSQWRKITSVERKEFTDAFRALVEKRYYIRWHKLFGKSKLTYLGEHSSDGDTLVKTKLDLGKKEDLLIWRLHKKGNSEKIVSLAVNERDLLSKIQSRFQKRLTKTTFPRFLAWLKDKAEVGEESSTEKSSKASSDL
jgi:ABC-type transporter MlaC component